LVLGVGFGVWCSVFGVYLLEVAAEEVVVELPVPVVPGFRV